MSKTENREREKLSNIVKRVSQVGQITQSDILDIMRCTRVILEMTDQKKQYPITNMFCNWSLHSNLTSPKIVKSILGEATAALRRHHEGAQGINESMTHVLDLSALRAELLEVHKSDNNVSQLFHTRGNWVTFLNGLLDDLVDRPIALARDAPEKPETAHGKIFKSLLEEHSYGMIVGEFFLTEDVRKGTAGIFWTIRLANYGRWIKSEGAYWEITGGPLVLTEDASSFYKP